MSSRSSESSYSPVSRSRSSKKRRGEGKGGKNKQSP